MQLVHLAFKGAWHHAFAQSFDAVHFGFHQTSLVIADPAFLDTSSQTPACSNGCIAVFKEPTLSGLGILSRGNDGLCALVNGRFIDRLCVVSAITYDALKRFIVWHLL